jgi:hypothetical protein
MSDDAYRLDQPTEPSKPVAVLDRLVGTWTTQYGQQITGHAEPPLKPRFATLQCLGGLLRGSAFEDYNLDMVRANSLLGRIRTLLGNCLPPRSASSGHPAPHAFLSQTGLNLQDRSRRSHSSHTAGMDRPLG